MSITIRSTKSKKKSKGGNIVQKGPGPDSLSNPSYFEVF